MTNVTEFKQTAQALVEAGAYFFGLEDYPNALDCLYRAHLKDEKNSEIMTSMGEVYRTIGDPFQALDWYILALHENPSSESGYVGIVRCCADMGAEMREAAYYYFAMGRKHGVLTPAELDALGEFEDEEAEEEEEEADDEGALGALQFSRGQRCLREHALSAAYAMFATVDERDENYKNARRLMIKIATEREHYSDAAQLADGLLALDPSDTEALIYGAKAYHELGDFDKRDEYYSRVVTDRETGYDDLEALAQVAWHMGKYEAALDYFASVRRNLPWDREILMQMAMCCANLGDRDSAKYFITLVKRLYPDDLALKYYAEVIDRLKGRASFEPLDCIPEPEAIRREDEIYNWMRAHRNPDTAMTALKKSPRLSEYLDWLFQEGDRNLQSDVGAWLAQSKKWRPYLDKLLISSYMSDDFKKSVLLRLLADAAAPSEFVITCGNIYRTEQFDPPLGIADCTLSLYRYTFVSLMFFGDGYEDDMNALYVKLDEQLKELNKRKKFDVPSMAAAICYRSNLTREKLSKEDCIFLFDCNEKKFEEYIDIGIISEIKTLRKQPRSKRKRRI